MGDLIVLGAVAIIAGLAIWKVIKNKKAHKTPCGCGSCPKNCQCHKGNQGNC